MLTFITILLAIIFFYLAFYGNIISRRLKSIDEALSAPNKVRKAEEDYEA